MVNLCLIWMLRFDTLMVKFMKEDGLLVDEKDEANTITLTMLSMMANGVMISEKGTANCDSQIVQNTKVCSVKTKL